MSLSHLFALEFAVKKNVYPILTVAEQIERFAQINELTIINIFDNLVGRVLRQIVGYMQDLRILSLRGCIVGRYDCTNYYGKISTPRFRIVWNDWELSDLQHHEKL